MLCTRTVTTQVFFTDVNCYGVHLFNCFLFSLCSLLRLTWMVEDLNVILLLDTFTMRCLESPTLDCWRRQCTAVHFFLNLLVMMILQLHQLVWLHYIWRRYVLTLSRISGVLNTTFCLDLFISTSFHWFQHHFINWLIEEIRFIYCMQ
jgi:hypothetical protein